MKRRSSFVVVLLLVACFSAYPQSSAEEEVYTIENCVNEFSAAKVESTKAGYQYWFADKNFIDGRTLKMSVVRPHSATHPPHKHIKTSSSLSCRERPNFVLMARPGLPARTQVSIVHQTSSTGFGMWGIQS